MNNSQQAELEQFISGLEKEGREFIYTAPPANECARIRFTGVFREQPVIWDATVMTIAWHNRTFPEQTDMQFIDIDSEGDVNRRIRIGLQLESIDEPVICKTIIMIRKYKRLRIGHHTFNYTSLTR